MSRKFKVITNADKNAPHTYIVNSPEDQYKYFKATLSSVLQNAHDTWAEIWCEFQDSVVQGVAISSDAEKGLFKPKCGWPELLEKFWLLKHYLDFAKKHCDQTGKNNK